MKGLGRRILSVMMCVVFLLSTNTNVIALTTNWDIFPPKLVEKASEIKFDAEVEAVIEKIDGIGDVAYDSTSLAKILHAEAAYDNLTVSQKEKVSNYGTLIAARKAYDVLAADHEDTSVLSITDSGIVNSTVKWYVYSNGLLEITGEGSVPTYSTSNTAPWYSYASSITRILVRSSVTSIGGFAFYGCTNVTEVTLPFVGASRTIEGYKTGYMNHIGYVFGYKLTDYWNGSAYDYPYSVGQFDGGQNNGYWCCYRNDYNASNVSTYQSYYVKADYTIPSALKKVTITDATAIGACAFKNCTNITEINLNDGIKTVGAYAFYENRSLKDFTIPVTVSNIEEYAFYNAKSLQEVYIPDAVTNVSNYSFYGCSSVTKLVIGKNVTSIGEYAFYENSALMKLEIPEKTTTIGTYAFSKCKTLTAIHIPDSVVSIGNYCFAGNTKVSKLEIGSGLNHIPTRAFQNNTALTKITVPDTVTSIGSEAFYGCTNLQI